MKGKFIEVYDNYIPPVFQNYIEDLILSKNVNLLFPLYINTSLSKGDNEDFGFENQYYTDDLHKGTIYQILYFLAIKRKIIIQDIYLQRVFLQTISKTPFIPKKHTDTTYPHWVCLYYVNDSDGDTILYDDNGKEIKRISPKKGRIVFFDGTIEHSAGVPTQTNRIVVNIAFKGIFI